MQASSKVCGCSCGNRCALSNKKMQNSSDHDTDQANAIWPGKETDFARLDVHRTAVNLMLVLETNRQSNHKESGAIAELASHLLAAREAIAAPAMGEHLQKMPWKEYERL